PSSSEEEITDDEGPIALATPVFPPGVPAVPAPEVTPGLLVSPAAPAAVPAAAQESPAIEVDQAVRPVVPQETTAVTQPVPLPAGDPVVTASVVVQEESVAMVNQFAPAAPPKRPTTGPASRFEWRTPPLWGFRDSGPYLHDGRADTIDQAIALHGGEAANVAQKFF